MVKFANILKKIIQSKNGIEIGGPSGTGKIIYKYSNIIDNVVWSNDTVWAKLNSYYNYYPGKIGKVIINDAVDINKINDETYDFCFSSHCLEHIANPLKAVKEWLRIIKNNGYIILILPNKKVCFDHKREYSNFSTLLQQYNNNVGEDDLSTLDEILEKHDLSLDPAAGTFEQFKKRSLDNFNNRCLHHYVYNQELLKEICNHFKCKYICTITQNLNIWFIMKKIF